MLEERHPPNDAKKITIRQIIRELVTTSNSTRGEQIEKTATNKIFLAIENEKPTVKTDSAPVRISFFLQ